MSSKTKASDDFIRAQTNLQKFIQENPDVFQELTELVDKYNAARTLVTDRLTAATRAEGEVRNDGPFSTSISMSDKWNLDEVERIVSPEEFDTAVEIQYKLRPKVGHAILTQLSTTKYAGLEEHHTKEIHAVKVEGPKAISLVGLNELQ